MFVELNFFSSFKNQHTQQREARMDVKSLEFIGQKTFVYNSISNWHLKESEVLTYDFKQLLLMDIRIVEFNYFKSVNAIFSRVCIRPGD